YRGQMWKPLLFSGLAVAAADMLSYRVIKGMITRPRPLPNEEIADWVRKVGEAHGPSFPSNHAANVFAVAMILGWYFPRARYFFYAFATLVAYSRVALGVHYPSDVLCGALLGIFVGLLIRSLVLNQFRLFQPRSKIS